MASDLKPAGVPPGSTGSPFLALTRPNENFCTSVRLFYTGLTFVLSTA
jgi:hypothetical protein